MIITNARVFLDGRFKKATFRVNNGVFTDIFCESGTEAEAAGASSAASCPEPEPGEEVIDCGGDRIIPGLFDIHTHGCLGHDFTVSSAEEDMEMLREYASRGVTSVLATTMTSAPDTYRRACGEIHRLSGKLSSEQRTSRENVAAPHIPAHLRGINAEGPFLSLEKKGAHDPQYVTPPDEEYFNELNSLSGGIIRLITIAPELEGAMDFIKKHTAVGNPETGCPAGLYLSVGHSDCDYTTAMEAFKAGSDHVTHRYNAMNGIHHRKPGIPCAAGDSNAWVELICDGLHVHESVIRHTFRAYPGRVVMISDSIAPTGLPDGEYVAGGLPATMKNGEIRLKDGTLAGSSTPLFEGLRRCITRFGIPEEEAILAATYNPAASVGMTDRCGRISEGLDADFLVLGPTFNLTAVYLSGTKLPPRT